MDVGVGVHVGVFVGVGVCDVNLKDDLSSPMTTCRSQSLSVAPIARRRLGVKKGPGECRAQESSTGTGR